VALDLVLESDARAARPSRKCHSGAGAAGFGALVSHGSYSYFREDGCASERCFA
jgi:hypothetical protein